MSTAWASDTGRPAPLFGAAREPVAGPLAAGTRRRRLGWVGFLLLMQAFLTYPVSDLVHRHLSTGVTAVVALALVVHAGLWMATMWLALATIRPLRAIAPWLVALTVTSCALAWTLHGQFVGLFIYTSIAAAVTLPGRWILPALAAATAAALIADLPRPVHLDPAENGRITTVITQLCLVFFLGLMMATYRRYMVLILELRAARDTRARLAVTEERLRIARDLHDLLGHSLSAISLKAQLAARLTVSDPEVAAEIADIHTLSHDALAEIRQAVTGYRETSLATELDTARDTLTAAGIPLSLAPPPDPLPPHLDALLGWVVREATTNIVRHSNAHHAEISLRRSGQTVTLRIDDDGAGPSRSTHGEADGGNGSGLRGLAERLAAVDGRLQIGTAPGGGFRLTATVPLPAVASVTGERSDR